MVCLGVVMPRWYAFMGIRLEVLWHSTRYFDCLMGLLALLHDQRWGVTDQQRIALAYWSEKVARELRTPPGCLEIVRTAGKVAPVRFVRYNGQNICHAPPGGMPANPLETIHHFIRATALALEGRSETEIAEQTLPEVARAAARVVLPQVNLVEQTITQEVPGGMRT